MYVCIYIYIYTQSVNICICVYTYMYIYIYIHIMAMYNVTSSQFPSGVARMAPQGPTKHPAQHSESVFR